MDLPGKHLHLMVSEARALFVFLPFRGVGSLLCGCLLHKRGPLTLRDRFPHFPQHLPDLCNCGIRVGFHYSGPTLVSP